MFIHQGVYYLFIDMTMKDYEIITYLLKYVISSCYVLKNA